MFVDLDSLHVSSLFRQVLLGKTLYLFFLAITKSKAIFTLNFAMCTVGLRSFCLQMPDVEELLHVMTNITLLDITKTRLTHAPKKSYDSVKNHI